MSDRPEGAGDARATEPAAAASETRPRPRYGEYATPEEQRARIRQPAVTQALEVGHPAGQAAAPVVEAPALRPGSAAAPAGVAARGSAVTARRPRVADRVATVALLGYGLFTVLSSFPAFVDYSAYADVMFDALGVDAVLSDPAAGRPWGVGAGLLLALGWVLTAALSWWSLRRGKVTWWIPLVAGVLFLSLAGVLMLVPLMNDPAVWQALVESAGGA